MLARDLLRRWWGLELGLAEAEVVREKLKAEAEAIDRGVPVQHGAGAAVAPGA